VHFGSFSALLPRSGAMIRDFAAGSGCLVSYDPNVRPTITPDRDAGRQEIAACIAVADIVKLSDADAEWLYPGRPLDDIAGDILRLGPSLIAITRGADGAIVQTPTMRVAVPGVPTRVIDTVGAGDTFMAALLWGLGQRGLVDRRALASAGEADLTGAASVACRAAAIVCARPGADPPFAAELEGSAAG